MPAKARKDQPAADARPSWTLVAPKTGNEYVVTSPVDRYNLLAQGYADKDPAAAAETAAAAENAATEQGTGSADGNHAVTPTADPGAGAGSTGASSGARGSK